MGSPERVSGNGGQNARAEPRRACPVPARSRTIERIERAIREAAVNVRSVSCVEEWATAIVELPVTGPLPARCVLVPSERVAHTLRRTLLLRDAAHALIGTRFVTLPTLAAELVGGAGESCLVNERERAPGVIRQAFEEVVLARFPRSDLCGLPGWDAAFARTLRELEDAELGAAALLASPDAQVADVGRVLAHCSADETLCTQATLLRRASMLASRAPGDPLLAVLTGFESLAELRLLRALPRICFARWLVRPASAAYGARASVVFGNVATRASTAAPLAAPGTALARLQESLFGEPPAAPAPADDSVRIVTYAGVHEEVEAAVGWVVEQIVVHERALGEIALLAPRAEVYASLLRARLSALPLGVDQAPLRVHAEVPPPLDERADGLRLLQVLRALREGLSRDALAPLLPSLRGATEGRYVRGLSRAWELLNAVAVTGGERANLRAGRVWPEAWESAVLRLEHPLLASGALEEREVQQRRELQADLASLVPAIEALTDVLRHVVNGEPLSMVWMCLAAFAQRHLRLAVEVPTASALLDDAVSIFEGQEECEPVGVAALGFLIEALSARGVQRVRFGEPAIYVGTLAGVRGLAFHAVRVLGLVEGALPTSSREDPVLPDAARGALSPWLPTSRTRAHRQLAAFDDAVRATRAQLVLSAPRASSEGSTRPPAAVLLDVVRALHGGGRPTSLERQLDEAARRGRAEERALRERLPVSMAARLERIARGDAVRARLHVDPARNLSAMHAIAHRTQASVQDGLLASVMPREALPGLDAARPISASRLLTLLSCPHRYLYEHLLGLREVVQPLPAYALSPLVFGSWLHDVAERFWRSHGGSLERGGLARDREALRAEACARFDALAPSYPFANRLAAEAQREALCEQLDKLLEHELEGEPRAFVDVERAFGYAAPCTLSTAAGPLYVRGKIDKLDRAGDTLLVRDIKTGSSKPRKPCEPPELETDLQLGVYAQVALRSATDWGTPARVGVAYLYPRGGEPERAWVGEDFAVLDAATRDWLATAVDTLEQRAFARTPAADDCRYCPHQPVCEPERERAAGVLRDPRVPRRLAQLKGGAAP